MEFFEIKFDEDLVAAKLPKKETTIKDIGRTGYPYGPICTVPADSIRHK